MSPPFRPLLSKNSTRAGLLDLYPPYCIRNDNKLFEPTSGKNVLTQNSIFYFWFWYINPLLNCHRIIKKLFQNVEDSWNTRQNVRNFYVCLFIVHSRTFSMGSWFDVWHFSLTVYIFVNFYIMSIFNDNKLSIRGHAHAGVVCIIPNS